MESTESSFKLTDRTVLLTGPCTTYNQAIASKFTQLGANVALVDRNVEKSGRFAAQLMDAREVHERYGRAIALQADLSKPHHVQDAVSRAAEAFGALDIYIDGLMVTDVKKFREPTALDDLDRILDVNLRSPLMLTHGVLRFLESRKRGRIIYMLQDLSRLGHDSNGLMAATRTGLMSFAKTMSRELAPSNITVNCVALGVTEDFLMSQNPAATSIQTAQEQLLRQYTHAPLMEPERMANLVAFLASPLGIGITGQTIAVSQGLSLI